MEHKTARTIKDRLQFLRDIKLSIIATNYKFYGHPQLKETILKSVNA